MEFIGTTLLSSRYPEFHTSVIDDKYANIYAFITLEQKINKKSPEEVRNVPYIFIITQ